MLAIDKIMKLLKKFRDYWRAREMSETLSGVTNSRFVTRIYVYLYMRTYIDVCNA